VKLTQAYKFAKQFNTYAYAVYFVVTVLERRLLTAAGTNWNFECAPTAKMFNVHMPFEKIQRKSYNVCCYFHNKRVC